MEYLEALGQVLREIRVAAGLSREGCSHVMDRDHLSKFEQGQQSISERSAELNISAIRGVRGKRAEDNRAAIRALQSEGLAKMEIVRRLGLSRATIDRYWLKPGVFE